MLTLKSVHHQILYSWSYKQHVLLIAIIAIKSMFFLWQLWLCALDVQLFFQCTGNYTQHVITSVWFVTHLSSTCLDQQTTICEEITSFPSVKMTHFKYINSSPDMAVCHCQLACFDLTFNYVKYLAVMLAFWPVSHFSYALHML